MTRSKGQFLDLNGLSKQVDGIVLMVRMLFFVVAGILLQDGQGMDDGQIVRRNARQIAIVSLIPLLFQLRQLRSQKNLGIGIVLGLTIK